jgi:hypothetical protein
LLKLAKLLIVKALLAYKVVYIFKSLLKPNTIFPIIHEKVVI